MADIPSPVSLDFDPAVLNVADGDEYEVVITGVPEHVELSHGNNNADGTWTLTVAQLSGLTAQLPAFGEPDFTVVATGFRSAEGNRLPTGQLVQIIDAPQDEAEEQLAHAQSPTAPGSDGNPTDQNSNASVGTAGEDNPEGVDHPDAFDDAEHGALLIAGTQEGTVILEAAPGQPEDLVTDEVVADAETGNTDHDLVDVGPAGGETVSEDTTADGVHISAVDVQGLEDTSIALNLSATLVDTDGSENLVLVVSGVPDGAVLSAAPQDGDKLLVRNTTVTPVAQFDGTVTFQFESAAYKNTFGSYQIHPQTGRITSVDIIWNDSSMADSGGSLVSGESSMPLALEAGQQLGFFIVSNGFTHNNGYQDLGPGQFEFHDADGSIATIHSENPRLVYVGEDGSIVPMYGRTYHTSQDATHYNLNPDGISHTTAHLDVANGTMTLGFEDMWVGGDGDYTDLVVELDVGTANAEAMQPVYTISDNLGVINNGDGTYTVAPEVLDSLLLTPPPDFGGVIDLSVTATATESATGAQARQSASFTLNVEAVADTPSLIASGVAGDEDTAIALDISASAVDVDGSETVDVTFTGVPSGAVLSAGTDNGDGSWTLSADQLKGLAITPPAHADENFTLTVSVTATEANGSRATSTTEIPVTVTAVADAAGLSVEALVTNEDTPVALNVDVAALDVDGSESLVFEISDLPEGSVLSHGVENDNGTWSLTADELANVEFTPPPNYEERCELTITAIGTEASNGDQAISTMQLPIDIVPVVDEPLLTVQATVGREDTAILIGADATRANEHGSESISLVISGVPEGARLSTGVTQSGVIEDAHSRFTPEADYQATVTFEHDTAQARNSVGAYSINPQTGAIENVSFVFTNASAEGEGGDLIPGESSVALDLQAGHEVGFFLVRRGDEFNDFDALAGGRFEFRNADGTVATGDSTTPSLVHLGDDGSVTSLSGTIFHSNVNDTSLSLNPDGIQHTLSTVDLDDHSIRIGFEDTLGGGDLDFCDVQFSIEVGPVNAQAASPTYRGGSNDGITDNGDGTFTVAAEYLDGLAITPPQDFSGELSLAVQAVATDGVSTQVVDGVVTVLVDAVADAPEIVSAAPAAGDEDRAITLNIDATTVDVDGSEALVAVLVADVPTGATLSAGRPEADGVWHVSPEALPGLSITPASDCHGEFALQVTGVSEEPNGSQAMTTVSVPVLVASSADAPGVSVRDVRGTEDNAIDLSLIARAHEPDSETLSVTIHGVPEDARLALPTEESEGPVAAPATFEVVADHAGIVTFQSETAGFQSSIGVYKIDNETGLIHSIAFLWENASAQGSGGDLIRGVSSEALDLSAGEQVGFFIIPNGFRANRFDEMEGTYLEFRDAEGKQATVDTVDPQLAYIPDGSWPRNVNGRTFHSDRGNADFRLNEDGVQHTRGLLDVDEGILTVSFEDLNDGGDQSFDDVVFTVDIGRENAEANVPVDSSEGLTRNLDGSWSVDPEMLSSLQLVPAADYSGELSLEMIAEATNELGDSATVRTPFNVAIDAAADAPSVITTPAEGREDTPIALNISGATVDQDGSEFLSSVVIADVPEGAQLSAGQSLGDGRFALTMDELSALTITPPSDSNVDFTLSVTMTSAEANGDTASTTTHLPVRVIGVADAPTVETSATRGAQADAAVARAEKQHSFADEDGFIRLQVNGNLTDIDGSETLAYVVSELPDGATLKVGTDNDDGTWSLTADEIRHLAVKPPAGFIGEFEMAVSAVSTENDGDTATTDARLMVSVPEPNAMPDAVDDHPQIWVSESSNVTVDVLEIGTFGNGAAHLSDWGNVADGKAVFVDGDVTVTTSVSDGVLHAHNGGSSTGRGIGNQDDTGLDRGETLVVEIEGGEVNRVDFTLDGLGSWFDENSPHATKVLITAFDADGRMIETQGGFRQSGSFVDTYTFETATPVARFELTADGDDGTYVVQNMTLRATDTIVTPGYWKDVQENGSITFDVLGNDTDADNDLLHITAVDITPETHGSVLIEADGRLTYTPDAHYHGPVSFTYTISDGRGGTDTATVRLNVAEVVELEEPDNVRIDEIRVGAFGNDRVSLSDWGTPIDGKAVFTDGAVTITTGVSDGNLRAYDGRGHAGRGIGNHDNSGLDRTDTLVVAIAGGDANRVELTLDGLGDWFDPSSPQATEVLITTFDVNGQVIESRSGYRQPDSFESTYTFETPTPIASIELTATGGFGNYVLQNMTLSSTDAMVPTVVDDTASAAALELTLSDATAVSDPGQRFGEVDTFANVAASHRNLTRSVALGDDDDTLGVRRDVMARVSMRDGDDSMVVGNDVERSVDMGRGNDRLHVMDDVKHSIRLGEGNDTLVVGDNAESLIRADAGDDQVIIGGDVRHVVHGGAGNDSIELRGYSRRDWDRNVDNVQSRVRDFENIRFSDGSVIGDPEAFEERSGSTQFEYTLKVTAALTDTDGSETLAVAIAGAQIPESVSALALSDGTTLTMDANGDYPLNVTSGQSIDVTMVTISELSAGQIDAISAFATTTESNGNVQTQVTGNVAGGQVENMLLGDAGLRFDPPPLASTPELDGNNGNNRLTGTDGDDVILGRGGDDILNGGAGKDHLYGGAGDDEFQFGPGFGADFVSGGDGINAVQLIGLGIGPSDELGEASDWTIEIDAGGESIKHTDNSLEFDGPASGSIMLADGSELNFQDIVRVEW